MSFSTDFMCVSIVSFALGVSLSLRACMIFSCSFRDFMGSSFDLEAF